MANIKLKNNYWVTESIYDTTDSKTQKQVNADLHQDIEDAVIVSDTQPSSDANQIWLPQTIGEGVQVPTWADHQELSGALNSTITPKGSVATNTDLNDIKEPGIYLIAVDRTYYHAPHTWGTLIVYQARNDSIIQQFSYPRRMFFRCFDTTTWYPWYELIDTYSASKTKKLFKPIDYFIGAIGPSGTFSDSTTRVRTNKCMKVPSGAKLVISSSADVDYRIFKYNSKEGKPADLASLTEWSSTAIDLSTYENSYIRLLIRNHSSPDSGISDPSKYYRLINVEYSKNILLDKPLSGLSVSILGDSFSSYSGYQPEGYPAYYPYNGVNAVSQMWWSVLCEQTGLEINTVNSYSGSSVTTLSGDYASMIPMSDNARAKALAIDNTYCTPDIIIIEGGINDFTYGSATTNAPLTWNPQGGNASSFTGTYASMVDKIRTQYPDALIVCLSTPYSRRGTTTGWVRTNEIGGVKYSQLDYDDAIKTVCKALRVPFLNIADIGFYQKYYPTFAIDSSTAPTHPNAQGHRAMGKYIAQHLIELVSAYTDNVI